MHNWRLKSRRSASSLRNLCPPLTRKERSSPSNEACFLAFSLFLNTCYIRFECGLDSLPNPYLAAQALLVSCGLSRSQAPSPARVAVSPVVHSYVNRSASSNSLGAGSLWRSSFFLLGSAGGQRGAITLTRRAVLNFFTAHKVEIQAKQHRLFGTRPTTSSNRGLRFRLEHQAQLRKPFPVSQVHVS